MEDKLSWPSEGQWNEIFEEIDHLCQEKAWIEGYQKWKRDRPQNVGQLEFMFVWKEVATQLARITMNDNINSGESEYE